jgi:ABC-type uncharacterized transport system substrate-binding protein
MLSEQLDRPAYERMFDEMETDRVDGLMVAHQGELLTNRQLIADLAAKHRLAAVYSHRDFVDVGGLLSYGADLGDAMRRLADMTDQVVKGAKPADLPVYQQTKFELVLNRTTAKSLGLEFPKIVLLTNPGNPMHRLVLANEASNTARSMGVALPVVEATTADELDTAFASAAAQHADAMIVFGDGLTNQEAPRVTALAENHHLPAIYLFRQFGAGGLIVYGPEPGRIHIQRSQMQIAARWTKARK